MSTTQFTELRNKFQILGGKVMTMMMVMTTIKDMDIQMVVLRVIWPKCTFCSRKALFLCTQMAKVCVSMGGFGANGGAPGQSDLRVSCVLVGEK